MQYKFKYKKGWLWKTEIITGHYYDKDSDRMDVFFPDGSIKSFGSWKDYDLLLGTDWKLAVQKNMEKESGTSVNVN